MTGRTSTLSRSPLAFAVCFFLGNRGIGGALLGRTPVAEHQQHVTATVERRGGDGAHNGEWLAGIVDHLVDGGHGITGGEALAHSGADQQVAFLDVRRIGHVAQLEALRVAGTAGNGAQTVAVDLHGNAVGGIGEQQDPRGIGHQFDHLPHQAASVEHRLTEKHAIALTLVDQDAVCEGVGIDADQFGNFDLFVNQRRGIEQLTQAHVLLGQRRQLLQATLQQQGLGLEFLVLGNQLVAAAELARHPLPGALRQVGDPVRFHEHQAHLAANGLEQVKARVDDHQRDRHHHQDEQANAQRRALGEKRFNGPFLVDDSGSHWTWDKAPAWLRIDG